MKIYGLTKLYLPLILFLGSILFFVAFKQQNEELFNISLENFGLSINIPIDSYILKKSLIILFGLFALGFYLFYDFTDFFPQKLIMEVFFDNEGITKCLSIYTSKDLLFYNIKIENIETIQNHYYDLMNIEAKKFVNTEAFSLNKKEVHSEGELTFIVEKIRGIQNYYIKEAKGELKHLIEKPNSKPKEFYTFFEKISSSTDKLDPPLYDIFVRNRIILTPRFKQIITEKVKSKGKVFNHVLASYTKIKLFPYPSYSNTIYLLEEPGVGLIPIGYAVYR